MVPPSTLLTAPAPEDTCEVRPAIAMQPHAAPSNRAPPGDSPTPRLLTALSWKERLSGNGTPPEGHLQPSRIGRKSLLLKLQPPPAPSHSPSGRSPRLSTAAACPRAATAPPRASPHRRRARSFSPSAALKAALRHARYADPPANQSAAAPTPAVCELKAGSSLSDSWSRPVSRQRPAPPLHAKCCWRGGGSPLSYSPPHPPPAAARSLRPSEARSGSTSPPPNKRGGRLRGSMARDQWERRLGGGPRFPNAPRRHGLKTKPRWNLPV